MVANMNNSSINAIPSSSNTADDLNTDKPVVLQVLFSVISLLAFGGNGLFCAVILRHHRLLRSPYHILIFSLAVTDMLTGKLKKDRQNYATNRYKTQFQEQ